MNPFEAFQNLNRTFVEREEDVPEMRRILEKKAKASPAKAKKPAAQRGAKPKGTERRTKQLNVAVEPSTYERYASHAARLGLSLPYFLGILLDRYEGGRDAR